MCQSVDNAKRLHYQLVTTCQQLLRAAGDGAGATAEKKSQDFVPDSCQLGPKRNSYTPLRFYTTNFMDANRSQLQMEESETELGEFGRFVSRGEGVSFSSRNALTHVIGRSDDVTVRPQRVDVETRVEVAWSSMISSCKKRLINIGRTTCGRFQEYTTFRSKPARKRLQEVLLDEHGYDVF